MTTEEMMQAWNAQDQAPLYGVNHYLLESALEQEGKRLRRTQRIEHWSVYLFSAGLLVVLLICALAFARQDGGGWNVAAAGLGMSALVASAGALWLSRTRQAQRERSFGASVSDEVRRNLSLIDYELSRSGTSERVLLTTAPFYLAAVLVIWLGVALNEKPFGWSEFGIIPVLLAVGVSSAIYGSREARQALTPRRQRLSDLLASLSATEG